MRDDFQKPPKAAYRIDLHADILRISDRQKNSPRLRATGRSVMVRLLGVFLAALAPVAA